MARTTFLTNSKGGVPSTCQVRNISLDEGTLRSLAFSAEDIVCLPCKDFSLSYEYFACMYVCTPCMFLVPKEVRARYLIALNLDFGMVVGHHMGVRYRDSGPLQEQLMLVTTEPSLISF